MAHERLATGGLARWTRFCATHPWRIVFGWIGLIVAADRHSSSTVGGSLKDEFTIPGSESQKATDLIKSEFASEQGGVLNLVFAAPRARSWTRPSASRRSTPLSQSSKASEFKATKDKVGIESVGDPFSADTFSKDRRIAYAEAQFNKADLREGSRPGRRRRGCRAQARSSRRA